MKIKKAFMRLIMFVLIIGIASAALLFGIDFYVKKSTSDRVISCEEAEKLENTDCIIVLGCGVWGDKPSHMLEDRLLTGLSLFENGVSDRLLMSGDHGKADYDEVNVMKKFAVDRGVESEKVFMDHAGFSTYDSVYRAKAIFECRNIVIVSQSYHLYRALYIAEKLGFEAYGVSASLRDYGGQWMRDIREILARDKDVVKCGFKPLPKYLGEAIPITGNGDLTNDN